MTTPPTPGPGRVVRWLVGTAEDQARFRDLHRRFTAGPTFGLLVGGSCTLVALWAGWLVGALVVVGWLTIWSGRPITRRGHAPEVVMAGVLAVLEINLAVSVAWSGGWDSPLLPLMAVPVFSQGVCLRKPVTVVGVASSAVLAALAGAAATLTSPPAIPSWVHLVTYVVLAVGLLLCVGYLADSDLKSRDEAVVDPLTGLLNRKALERRFATPTRSTAALLMVDVDHFKRVNDEHGHPAGDAVLRELGRRLRTSVRDEDTVFRLGGEEFVVLCPGTSLADAAASAERLRLAVAGVPVAGLPVTVSIGVSAGATPGLLATMALLSQADDALYAAKRAGRDRVHVGSPARVPGGEPLSHAG